MGLNSTPMSDRVHIGIFGKRNAGKSSVINAITGQNLAIVSEIMGTTTDPVSKTMELLPLGPVVLIDTPGLDDEGELGRLRVQKSYQVLNKTDVALLIVDAATGVMSQDKELIQRFQDKKIPYLIVYNKTDLITDPNREETDREIWVSAATGENIHALKEKLAVLPPTSDSGQRIVADLLLPSDFVVLVTPIDKAAPKGRLILPQQQTIRDILEADATAIVVKEHEFGETLAALGKKPKLVITDSQVFAKISEDTPGDIPLTSFSILFARYKGILEDTVRGVLAVEFLEDGDKVLVCEGCTHHRQCDDIGTVKIPRWLRNHTAKELDFSFVCGTEFPDDLSPYKLIIHCGGCTLNEREVKYRMQCAKDQSIPMTNYGILIAYIQGILKRSVDLFPNIARQLEK